MSRAQDPEPMVTLIRDLRSVGFEITSATRELGSDEPIARFVTPDRNYMFLVEESTYRADPHECVSRIRHYLRHLGYPC